MADFNDARQTWDRRFSQAEGTLFGSDPNRWLAAQGPRLSPGARVLCIADGEGRNGVWLAERGCDVVSFDISPVGVDRARRLAAQRGVRLDARIADIAGWHWEPDAYDAVVGIFFQFAGPALRQRIFEGLAATLAPGGLLILEGYGPRQLRYRTGGPGVQENLYTMPMLLHAFDGWPVLASRDADVDMAEGSGHHGRSHVVSAVLRKPACAVTVASAVATSP